MSYLTQARMCEDGSLMARITACASTQDAEEPQTWAYDYRWKFSAQPGWVDAYKYAVDSGDEEPGANEGAITDAAILSAVQALMAEEQE